jgi:hypothetical protein
MSALGQKQTFPNVRAMSALPPIADISSCNCDVRFVPVGDITSFFEKDQSAPHFVVLNNRFFPFDSLVAFACRAFEHPSIKKGNLAAAASYCTALL